MENMLKLNDKIIEEGFYYNKNTCDGYGLIEMTSFKIKKHIGKVGHNNHY